MQEGRISVLLFNEILHLSFVTESVLQEKNGTNILRQKLIGHFKIV